MNDPFKDIRNKRMSELNPEQRDLAMELWLRQNDASFGGHYSDRHDALFPSVFRVIDALRKENRELRRKLCLARAGSMAYMDDGEAQDNRAHPCIDYMRDSIEEIERKRLERMK